MSSELCVRCGNKGEDRRTLWMACFYDMEEMKEIPFIKRILFHADLENCDMSKAAVSIPLGNSGKSINLDSGRVKCSGDLTPHSLYTLRVCKRCRADWMDMIKNWFLAVPKGEDHDSDNYTYPASSSCNSGIFIRENGQIKEITQKEWDDRNKTN